MVKASSVKKTAEAHPVLIGALIGAVLLGVIIVIETWFPWIGNAWERHDKAVRSAWCTVALFVVCIYRLSGWRHRRGFWLVLSVFFTLHVVAVVFYSTYVHPLFLQEWVILLLAEAAVVVYILAPLLQRLKSRNHLTSPSSG